MKEARIPLNFKTNYVLPTFADHARSVTVGVLQKSLLTPINFFVQNMKNFIRNQVYSCFLET